MDKITSVKAIESTFDFQLPMDYRAFLMEHPEDLADPIEIDALVSWPRGPTATVDCLYSSASILKNDGAGASCDLEQSMLIVGHSLFGGYLYLCWGAERFGQIFFREPFLDPAYYLVAKSFGDLLSRSRPVVYDDEA